MINILLVDDQNLVREGIKSLLELKSHICVIAEACDGQEALEQLENCQPDVILLDIRMPKLDGLAVLKHLNETDNNIPTLVLTTFDEHDLVLDCLKLGAKGYLRKDVSLESLITAIEKIANGEKWIKPATTTRIEKNLSSHKLDEGLIECELTNIEQQVLRLVAAGYSNHEIAAALHRSVGTVRNQVSFILNKLNVRDRTRAVLKAVDLGLI